MWRSGRGAAAIGYNGLGRVRIVVEAAQRGQTGLLPGLPAAARGNMGMQVGTPHSPRSQHGQAAARDPVAWRLADLPAGGGLAAAEAFCRAVARRHYENFTVATRLVPPRLRQHLANVYAFARWADDLGDESASPAEASAALGAWREELDACFAGRPRHPVLVALAETIRCTGLGREPFADLIDAFEQDQAGRGAGDPAEHVEQGALPGTRGPRDRHELPAADAEIHAAHGGDRGFDVAAGKGLLEMLGAKDRG